MQRVTLLILMVVMMVGAFIAFITLTDKPAVNPFSKKEAAQVGEAAIGGAFTLTNQNGEQISNTDFSGKFMLVYFGYSFCPDVCPADLLTITSAMQALGEDADNIAPIFITIDPERDTVEQLHLYMQNFDPRITALTGSAEEIADAAKAYRVYYQEAESEDTEQYLMDHTAITYLMDKNGKYLSHFPHGTDSTVMAEKLQNYINK